MEKELKRLKRRPFMFPLLLPVVLMAVVVMAGLWVWDMRPTTVVVIVRHAEVDADGNPDPNLSLLGRERAARLARMLSEVGVSAVGVKEGVSANRGVDAIYASELRRTQQTAAPLAEALSLGINVHAAAGWNELGDVLKSEQQGKVVLVVGHSNTVPALVEALAGEKVTIGETEFDHLYVVFVPRLSRTRLLHLRF